MWYYNDANIAKKYRPSSRRPGKCENDFYALITIFAPSFSEVCGID